MLFRVRYTFKEEMMAYKRLKVQEKKSYENSFAINWMDFSDKVQNFYKGLYEDKLKDIRIYLKKINKKNDRWIKSSKKLESDLTFIYLKMDFYIYKKKYL